MKTLNAFIHDLAAKANLPLDNEHLKGLLSHADLQKLEVPEELEQAITNNLISIEQAKNNHPVIKPHYTADVYNGLDTQIKSLMDELQLPDNVKLVIGNEKLTANKVKLLVTKIRELEAEKRGTTDKTEKQSLQADIDRLNAEVRTHKEAAEKIRTEYAEREKNMQKQSEIISMLSEYPTAFDKLPKAARNNALLALIDKELQDKDAKLELDENGKLKLIRKDGANVFGRDNKPWDAKTLFDHTLSTNKVLLVNDQKTNKDDNNSGNDSTNKTKTVTTGDGNNAKQDNATMNSLIDASLKDLEKSKEPQLI